ncbi:hypothetical protein [Microbulbifer sp. S227A]|uniref:hypothetical protein n=1 Tax=Microbulbifer sp. S227A TaxID=3415131 RepID=UPI003C7BD7BF
MNYSLTSDFGTPAEHLNTLANLVELALYAPEGEITHEGRVALQRATRQIVVLSGGLIEAHADNS